MRPLRCVVALVACVVALGVARPAILAAPAGAGDVPEDQGDLPTVDGNAIVATYRYEGKPFFEGGYILKMPQADNFESIDCGANGTVNPGGGPDGAPECGFHPAVTEATVTITGKVPWFDVAKSFQVVPYWSFDDKTYVRGDPITIKAPKSGKVTSEQAGQAYLEIGAAVNFQLTQIVGKIEAWDKKTTGKQAAADVASLDQALDEAKDDLKALRKDYPPAKKVTKAQIKAINALQGDLTAVGSVNEGLDLAKWKEQFNKHLQDLSDASDKVRAKLGLPATNAGGAGANQPALD